MKQYTKGKKPVQIFRDAGFDPKTLGSKRIERCKKQEIIIHQLQADRRAVQRILNRRILDVSETPASAETNRTVEEETEHKQEPLAERNPE